MCKANDPDVSIEYLHELFWVDADGVLRRHTRKGRKSRLGFGTPVGGPNHNGYLRTRIGNKDVMVHRIIYAMHYGSWPSGVVDHIDGNIINNNPSNLRDVTQRVNTENHKKAQPISISKLIGAHYNNGSYCARLQTRGVTHYLGNFPTPELAHEAYIKAKRELHEGNTL